MTPFLLSAPCSLNRTGLDAGFGDGHVLHNGVDFPFAASIKAWSKTTALSMFWPEKLQLYATTMFSSVTRSLLCPFATTIWRIWSIGVAAVKMGGFEVSTTFSVLNLLKSF